MKKTWRQLDGNCLWKEDKIVGDPNFMLFALLIFEFAIMNMYYFGITHTKKNLKKNHRLNLPFP